MGLIASALAQPASAGDIPLYGSFGPEGPRMREQLWLLPSGTPDMALRATLFRPAQSTASATATHPHRWPLVVINHGTSEAWRLSASMPVYYWLSRWFVERGYAVLLPQRRGHGATGGELAESIGTCADPDHQRSGQVAADDIEASVDFLSQQPFIEPRSAIVVGISTGGWASLALASRNAENVAAVINFAGGRGGHAGGVDNAVCGEQRLIAAAKAYGHTARVPTVWLYSKNDSYFGPSLATALAGAWEAGGGTADLHILPAYGADGHDLVNDQAGWNLWGPIVDRFLANHHSSQVTASVSGAQ
jgi:dienelactone hydrolase